MKIDQQEFLYYLCGSTYIVILFFRIIYAKVLQEMEHVSHSKSKSLNMKFYDVAANFTILDTPIHWKPYILQGWVW